MSLTDKQQRFVEEYLVDLNATQAAIRAGYSERSAGQIGHDLLKKHEIVEALRAAMQARSERTQVTADRVVRELARIGFSDLRDLMTWTRTVVHFTPSDDLTEEQAAVVSSVKSKTTTYSRDDGTEQKIELELKTYDKLGALRDLGRHLGMFSDRVVHTGDDKASPIRFADMSDDEVMRRAQLTNRVAVVRVGNGSSHDSP